MSSTKNIIPSEEVEKKMNQENNQIAMELLMPEKPFKDAWATTNSAKEVAAKFEVSESAVALRGAQLLNQMFI